MHMVNIFLRATKNAENTIVVANYVKMAIVVANYGTKQ